MLVHVFTTYIAFHNTCTVGTNSGPCMHGHGTDIKLFVWAVLIHLHLDIHS